MSDIEDYNTLSREYEPIGHTNVGFEDIENRPKENSNGDVFLSTTQTIDEKIVNNAILQSYKKNGERKSYAEIFEQGPPSPQKKKGKPEIAVSVRNAVKSYGSETPTLNNFNMTVQKGTIYSLLGSSGCGKTTLLSCVVGLRNISKGEIKVFGFKPGTRESGIPSNRVGYMPQEVALYHVFSICEILQYFGTLNGMKYSEIKSAQDFLVDFLGLPDASRRIGSLSGGQKRRVSLAVALIHSPKLLILDEPTVGVDPLLRRSIWDHLTKLVSNNATTVVITTHYIEEAKQSNTVGIMRGGKLLAEENTETLLHKYNTRILEDVVLHLCHKDTRDETSLESDNNDFHLKKLDCDDPGQISTDSSSNNDYSSSSNSINRLKALIKKNLIVMFRNSLLLAFILVLPALVSSIICVTLGGNTVGLKFGIVNHEANCSSNDTNTKINVSSGCDLENLSCKLLSMLPSDTMDLVSFETSEVARQAVKDGEAWGFLIIPKGYSDNIYGRATGGNVLDIETLEGSQIFFEMDETNTNIALKLKKEFYDAFKSFIQKLLTDCGFYPEIVNVPLTFRKPVYGSENTEFGEFVAPGFVLGIIFFFPMCSSSISNIWDKKQGTLERGMVSGVKTWEIMIALITSEGAVLLIQSVLMISTLKLIHNITIHGSLPLAIFLGVLMGISGLSMGCMIAPLCNEEIEAALVIIGFFLSNFLLCGIIWPIEAQPEVLKQITSFLPLTRSCEAFRSIVSRGWGFTHPNVWPGFLIPLVWVGFLFVLTTSIHKLSAARK